MKKAVIEQLLLGFILISTTIVFVATVIDDRVGRNKYSNLEDIANETIVALGQEYYKGMNGDLGGDVNTVNDAICQAEEKITNLIDNTDLGNEIKSNNDIHFTWRDLGEYNATKKIYEGTPDGRPDTITVRIDDYTQETFWYRFIGKDTLNLPAFSKSVDLNQYSFNVDVTFRGVIQAGYYNMVGTYELDDKGCPTNAKLILDDKDKWKNKIGDTIAKVPMPQTRMFFIADGLNRFGSNKHPNDTISLENTSITFDNNNSSDCTKSLSYPTAVITTDDGRVQRSDDRDVTGWPALTSRANVYFQDDYLNFDNKTPHIRAIAEKDWGAFIAYIESPGDWNSEAKNYSDSLPWGEGDELEYSHDYNQWLAYAKEKGITFDYDPNGNYVFVSEDLANTDELPKIRGKKYDPHDYDGDFTDMSFSMKKIFIPTPIDTKDIDQNKVITPNCSTN
ncbi:hypothetical protein ACMC56_02080 [Campylobacterota bacterium DY0563]